MNKISMSVLALMCAMIAGCEKKDHKDSGDHSKTEHKDDSKPASSDEESSSDEDLASLNQALSLAEKAEANS